MASSKRDFERFVVWLDQPENQAPSNVRRLANLVLAHFDELAQTSRQLSQRSYVLVGLARSFWAQTPDGPPNIHAVLIGRRGCSTHTHSRHVPRLAA
jgi:hypothetical protein